MLSKKETGAFINGAQTVYKCFKDGIKAVPRDPVPTTSPLQELGDIPWVELHVFSLASDIPCCFCLAPPRLQSPPQRGFFRGQGGLA